MSFWDLSDGDSAVTGQKEYEQDTGNFDPIPDNSNVLAEIDEVKWDTTQNGDEFLSVRWVIMEPAPYANRKIFQKLWVTDDDPNVSDSAKMQKKRDKAKKMLAALDANCGGRLAKASRRPNNDDLALALSNRPMIIKCMVWTMTNREGQGNSGNWISAVFPKEKGVSVTASAEKPASVSKSAPSGNNRLVDDDIPF